MNIKIKIDVKKINKNRLYEGAKGTYLNAVLIESANEYSDFMIVEEVTAEERAMGEKGTILGNGSYLKPRESVQTDSPAPAHNADVIAPEQVKDDLQF